MFPYNLQNYKPKADPEEPVPKIRFKKAKEHSAKFMSKDGKFIFREFFDGFAKSEWSNESMDYGSWWAISELPDDVEKLSD